LHVTVLLLFLVAVARYRTAFVSLRELRSSLDPAVDSLAAAKEALLAGFEAWLGSQQGQQLGATQQVGLPCVFWG
jgi:hypothetical protein